MAWVRRGSTRYFYRSRRTLGGVLKEYVGTGPRAAEAAREIEERRKAAIRERTRLYDERASVREAEVLMRELQANIRLLVGATLTAAGYHQSASREWRKKRR